jgi:multiple sugar transport system substrate-binding protein
MAYDRLMAYRHRVLTRRQALKTTGAGIAGAAAASGLGGLVSTRALAAEALTYAFWPWGQEIVEENARRFEALYGETLNLEPIPGDYLATLETKLAGGAPIDMFRAQRGQASRWHAAGWIQPLNGFPDLEKIKSEMFPNIVESSMAPNGDFLGLTYYDGGPFVMFRNEKVLSAAGYEATANVSDYPSTWEEITKQARDIKKKGIVEHPILVEWNTEWVGLPWGLLNQCTSEGEGFVNDQLEGTFGPDTPILKVLSQWKEWWDEDLVPRALLSMTESDITQSWMKGEHAFYPMLSLYSFLFNDPEATEIAAYNNQNPLMPGATNDTTLVGHALRCIRTRDRSDEDLARVWNLMKYYGWRDETGDLFVAKKWALMANLEAAFPEVYDDPEVKAKILGWMYKPLAEEEYGWLFDARARAKTPLILKAAWYEEWDKVMHDMISQEMLIDASKTPKEVVVELRQLWDDLHAKYT